VVGLFPAVIGDVVFTAGRCGAVITGMRVPVIGRAMSDDAPRVSASGRFPVSDGRLPMSVGCETADGLWMPECALLPIPPPPIPPPPCANAPEATPIASAHAPASSESFVFVRDMILLLVGR